MTVPEEISQHIEWGMAARNMKGQTGSGDSHLIRSFPNGILVAVIDGLGHGHEAAIAAKKAVASLSAAAHEPLFSLMNRCHKDLADTRGAVISLASLNFQKQTMTWLGVGSVEAILLRANPQATPVSQNLLLYSGVLGYRLPPLHESTISLEPGDTLILATDGVRRDFSEKLLLKDSPQKIADHIMEKSGKDTDDALVLVVRYLGLMP
jgi:negative regulator of sigma-B (phosphoserine phosphatase)